MSGARTPKGNGREGQGARRVAADVVYRVTHEDAFAAAALDAELSRAADSSDASWPALA